MGNNNIVGGSNEIDNSYFNQRMKKKLESTETERPASPRRHMSMNIPLNNFQEIGIKPVKSSNDLQYTSEVPASLKIAQNVANCYYL